LAARFQPVEAIARADKCLERAKQAFSGEAHGHLSLAALKAIHKDLLEAHEELDLIVEFYRNMTPGASRFALSFGFGMGGLLGMPFTGGWSLIATYGSAGVALNELRDLVDSKVAIRRVERRQETIQAYAGRIDQMLAARGR